MLDVEPRLTDSVETQHHFSQAGWARDQDDFVICVTCVVPASRLQQFTQEVGRDVELSNALGFSGQFLKATR